MSGIQEAEHQEVTRRSGVTVNQLVIDGADHDRRRHDQEHFEHKPERKYAFAPQRRPARALALVDQTM
jgi:hypothetical protein